MVDVVLEQRYVVKSQANNLRDDSLKTRCSSSLSRHDHRRKQSLLTFDRDDGSLSSSEEKSIIVEGQALTSVDSQSSSGTSTSHRRSHRPRGCRGGRKNRQNTLSSIYHGSYEKCPLKSPEIACVLRTTNCASHFILPPLLIVERETPFQLEGPNRYALSTAKERSVEFSASFGANLQSSTYLSAPNNAEFLDLTDTVEYLTGPLDGSSGSLFATSPRTFLMGGLTRELIYGS